MRDRYDLSGNFQHANISIVTHGASSGFDIDGARNRLAKMPTRHVPPVAHLPLGSAIPWRPNPAVQGRDPELIRLASACAADPRTEFALAITGMGGVGKTQLAAEFCHRYGTFFAGGAFWIQCGQPDEVPSQFASIGTGLGLENLAELDLADQVRLVRRELASSLPRLLVLDGCDDEQVLAEWRPPSGACRVIVTSRKADWPIGSGVQTIPLAPLERASSIALLRTKRPDLGDDDPALAEIAGELGDLPLALHLAGCFLSRFRRGSAADADDYLKSLRRAPVLRHRSLTAGGWSPTGHEQHVAKTFAVALDQLDPADDIGGLARFELRFASRLAPGVPIPRYMLSPTADEMAAEPNVDVSVLEKQEEALLRLGDLGLLSLQDDGSAIMHTLVAAFADDAIDDVVDGESIADRVEIYMLDLLSNLLLLKDPRETVPLSPHLRCVASLAEVRKSQFAAPLHLTLGQALYEAGDFSGSSHHFARAEEIAPLLSPEGSDDHIRAVGGRAISLRLQGDIAQSIALHRRALAKLETEGPRSRGIAVTKFNLACALEGQAPEEAQDLLVQLLDENGGEIASSAFDSHARREAYDLRVRILTALGKLVYEQDRDEGCRLLRNATILALSLEGPHSLDRWQPLSILGSIAIEERRYEHALRLFTEAVEAIMARRGNETGLLADPLLGLGRALMLTGDFKRAREPLNRALELTERHVGLGYPGARRGTVDLATAYIECRQYKLARALLEKELEYLEQNGGSVSDRAQALQMLIVAFAASGDRRNAKRQQNRLLAMIEEASQIPSIRTGKMQSRHPLLPRT